MENHSNVMKCFLQYCKHSTLSLLVTIIKMKMIVNRDDGDEDDEDDELDDMTKKKVGQF